MKTALVTGASRGLGAVIAKALSDDGWAVAVNYFSDGEGAGRVASDIRAKGGQAHVVRFNVRDEKAIRSGIEDIASALSPVDLVVNNAMGPHSETPLTKQSWQHYLDQLEFAVKAPFDLLQALLPDWRARKSGRIINIGSEIAELGNPEFAHYAAAKGAMLSMTRSWASELAPEGITVNLVAPGWIPVERHADAPQSARDFYLARTPMAHFGVPQNIADAVVFLASSKADFITGQRLAVNGGRTLV